MKLSLAAITALPVLAYGYNMGGAGPFGRRIIITGPRAACGPSASCEPSVSRKDSVDRAFDQLQNEAVGRRRQQRRSRRFVEDSLNGEMDSAASLRQKQEWFNRAFGLAQDVASGLAGESASGDSEYARRQQELLDRAFGIASDVSSGQSSPRYDINDTEEAFQITMDVPGVKLSDIDISVTDEDSGRVLSIQGEREMSKVEGVSRAKKFSKSFSLDTSVVESDNISAELKNGVLIVSAPKNLKKIEKKTRKIQVEISDEDSVVPEETEEKGVDNVAVDTDVADDSPSSFSNDKEDQEKFNAGDDSVNL